MLGIASETRVKVVSVQGYADSCDRFADRINEAIASLGVEVGAHCEIIDIKVGSTVAVIIYSTNKPKNHVVGLG